MRKRAFKRLHLLRETLWNLEAVQGAVDGYTMDSTVPGQCCNTVTNPALNQSGACEPRTTQCDTNQCH